MDKLFNMDNKFFSMMGRAADLMILNIVFIICCLPIVTISLFTLINFNVQNQLYHGFIYPSKHRVSVTYWIIR